MALALKSPTPMIRLTPESLLTVGASWRAESSALEHVDVNGRFYGEFLNNEQMIATFRDRKSAWVLTLAKNKLAANEYDDLFQLVNARFVRSEREVFVTARAITTRRSRETQS